MTVDRASGRVDGDSDDTSEGSGVAGTWRRGRLEGLGERNDG
jgi:hypothetical protein